MLSEFINKWRIRRHSRMTAEHYRILHNRYCRAYGDIIEASRTQNPEVMLQYLMASMGLRDGMSVLDAGCGTCGPSRYFAERVNLTIKAITLSNAQLNDALRINKTIPHGSRIEAMIGDFHFLDHLVQPASLDLVFFLESFCHSYSPETVIHQSHKALKKGGVIYLKDWFLSEQMKLKDSRKYADMRQRINHFYCFNLQEGFNEISSVVKLLTDSGFEVEFCQVPGYETNNYELTAFFHGHNDTLGPNDFYRDNYLGGELEEVFQVIEIAEIKAIKK